MQIKEKNRKILLSIFMVVIMTFTVFVPVSANFDKTEELPVENKNIASPESKQGNIKNQNNLLDESPKKEEIDIDPSGKFNTDAVKDKILDDASSIPENVIKPEESEKAFSVKHTVKFSKDDFNFKKVEVNDETEFDIVSLTDGAMTFEPGLPMMPAKNLKIALPPDMKATNVRVLSSEEKALDGVYSIYPAQLPMTITESFESDSDEIKEFIKPDERVYKSVERFPSQTVVLGDQNSRFGQSMVSFSVFPMRYNPLEKKLTLTTSITFEIEGDPGYVCSNYLPNSYLKNNRRRDECKFEVEQMVVNPEDVELQAFAGSAEGRPIDPPRSGTPEPEEHYEYVIITIDDPHPDEDWVKAFQPLADWRTQKGIPSKIVTTDWIYGNFVGADEQEKIREFIKYAYVNWSTTSVLLGGDSYDAIGGDIIPTRYKSFYGTPMGDIPGPTTLLVASDTYYADYNDDWVCEVDVGRAPVDSESEVDDFVSKILNYEKNPPRSDFAKNIGLFAFELIDYCDDAPSYLPGWLCKEKMIDEGYIPPNMEITKVYDQYGNPNRDHRGEVINAINSGQNLINHIDHCSWNQIGTATSTHICGPWCDTTPDGYITINGVNNLHNQNKSGIMYSVGCWPVAHDKWTHETGDEPYREDCIAEHFIQNTNGGGVAFVGNSRYGISIFGCPEDYASNRYDLYFFKSIFSDEYVNEYNHFKLGECFSDHKNDAHGSWPAYAPYAEFPSVFAMAESIDDYIFSELTLLGDPEMLILTEDPKNLDVTHDDVFTSFTQEVIVRDQLGYSSVKDALVCLSYRDESGIHIIAKNFTDENGCAELYIDPDFSGEADLTVTAHNYIYYNTSIGVCPFEHNIRLGHIMAPSVSPVNEDLELGINVYNTGHHTENNIYVNFSVDEVLNATVFIQTLESGACEQLNFIWWNTTEIGSYLFCINTSFVDNYSSDNERETQIYVTTFPDIPSNPDPEDGEGNIPRGIVNLSFDGGDPDVGDTVEFNLYSGTDPYCLSYKESKSGGGGSSYRVEFTLEDAVDWDTTYYWKIITKDNHGARTEGPLWQFEAKNRPEEIQVNRTWTSGNHGGTEWGYDAFNNIPDAVDVAATGADIFVHPGTYCGREDNPSGGAPLWVDAYTLFVSKTVNIIGADKDTTIINGGDNGNLAVYFYYADDATLSGFTITSSYIAVKIEESDDVRVFNTIIDASDGTGIELSYGSLHCEISQCFISNNSWGINIHDLSLGDHIISNNIFADNEWGIEIGGYLCGGNRIYYNAFFNYTEPWAHARDNNGDNSWDDGIGEGNYWDDFDEPIEGACDSNSDGIADGPRDIFNLFGEIYGTDHFPLMNPKELIVDAGGPYEGVIEEDISFFGFAAGRNSPFNYTWDFGDDEGVSYEQNPTHVYSEPGIYTVMLTVNDSATPSNVVNDTATAVVKIIDADAHGPYEGYVDVDIWFNGTAVGGDGSYEWLWDFGDGSQTSDQQETSHSYSEPGIYSANLTVTDDESNSDTDTAEVTIYDKFNLDAHGPYFGIVDLEVQFHGSVNGDPSSYSWSWDFGDGSFLIGQNPTHTYENNGIYNVTLTVVKDGDCATVETTATISDHPSYVEVDDNYDIDTPFWGYNRTDNIPDAIDMVAEGGTVYVHVGTYYGRYDTDFDHYSIVVNKPVMIIGECRETTNIVQPYIGGIDYDGQAVVIPNTDIVTISNFTISDASHAIFIEDSNFVNISYNIIKDSGSSGVYIQGMSNYCNISNNLIENINGMPFGANGIVICGGTNNKISNNTLRYNDRGINIDAYSAYNVIYQNDIYDNERNYLVSAMGECFNYWNNSEKGNYWGDYLERYPDAAEINDSGIWNSPYVILDPDLNADHLPVVHPFCMHNKAPVANLRGCVSGLVDEMLTFHGEDSMDPDGEIVSYMWDFGDGTYGSGATFEKSYLASGTYEVSLVVRDDDGATDKTVIVAEIYPKDPLGYPIGGSPFWSGTEIVSIESDGTASQMANIAVESDGTVHVVWGERETSILDFKHMIMYKKRTPDGNWTLPEIIAGGVHDNACRYPDIVVDSKGAVHVIWRGMGEIRYRMKEKHIERWHDAPGSCVVGSKIDETYNPLNKPAAIAVDKNDEIHLAWIAGKFVNITTYEDPIFYRKKTELGGWGPESSVETADEADDYYECVSLAVDNDSTVHVVWAGRVVNPVSYGVYYKQKPRGGSWSVRERVCAEGKSGLNVCVAAELDGTVHVTWDNITGFAESSEIFYRRRPSDGSFADEPIEIMSTESILHAKDPSVDVDSNGGVHVVWRGTTAPDTTWDIFYRKKPRSVDWIDAGQTEVVSSESSCSNPYKYPSVFVDGNDTVHAVWQDLTDLDEDPVDPDTDIFYKRRNASYLTPWREPGPAVGPYGPGEPGTPFGGAGIGDGDITAEAEGLLGGPGSSGYLGSDVVGRDGLYIDIATGEVKTVYPVCSDFMLIHSSLIAHYNGVLSDGWTFDSNIFLNNSNKYCVGVTDGYGWGSTYTLDENGEYVRPIGRLADLINDSGVFKLEYFDGSITVFTNYSNKTTEILFPDGLYHIDEFYNRFGEKKSFTYDDGGNLTKITTGFGRVVSFEYEGGLLRNVTDPSGRKTQLIYGWSGEYLLSEIKDSTGNKTSYWYGGDYRLFNLTTKNGVQYRIGGNYEGSVERILEVLNGTNWNDWEEVVRVSASSFPERREDGMFEPGVVTVTDGRGNTVCHTRNGYGRRVKVVSLDFVHQVFFDDGGAGPLIMEVNAHNFVRSYEYDEFDNVVSFTNELGHVTNYLYEHETPALRTEVVKGDSSLSTVYNSENNRLIKINDPVGNDISFDYAYFEDDESLPNRVETVTRWNRLGDSIDFTYDSFGYLTEKTVHNPDGVSQFETFEYYTEDPDTFLLKKHTVDRGPDFEDFVTSYEDYDDLGRCLKVVVDPDGFNLVASLTYGGGGNVLTETNPNGIVTKYEYDLLNRQNKTINDYGGLDEAITDFTYDLAGNLVNVNDPLGNDTKYVYDGLNRLTMIEDVETGHQKIYAEYDALGNLKEEYSHQGSYSGPHIVYTYDGLNRVTSTTVDPDGLALTSVVIYEDNYGSGTFSDLIYKTIDPEGKSTYCYYDSLERLNLVVRKVGGSDGGFTGSTGADAFGWAMGLAEQGATRLGSGDSISIYDEVSDSISASDEDSPYSLSFDSESPMTSFSYDAEGNLVKTVGPEGGTIEYVYDAVGQIIKEIQVNYDGDGDALAASLGSDGAIQVVTDPDGDDLVTSFVYDGMGNLIHKTLPNGNVFTYEYDDVCRQIKTSDSIGLINEIVEYDNNGNVLETQDFLNRTQVFDYDNLDRVIFSTDAEGYTDEYQYDNRGQLICHIDSNGVCTNYTYNSIGQVKKVLEDSTGDFRATEYDYNVLGEIEEIRDNASIPTRYEYDSAGRCNKIRYPDQGHFNDVTFEHDKVGNVISRIDQNRGETFVEYDDLHRPIKVTFIDDEDESVSEFVYDRSDRLVSAVNEFAGWGFSYDGLGRKKWQEQTIFENDYGDTIVHGPYRTSYDYLIDPGLDDHVFITYPSGRDVKQYYDLRSRNIETSSNLQGMGEDVSGAWMYNSADELSQADLGNGIVSTYVYDDLSRLININHNRGETLCYGDQYIYDPVGNIEAIRKGHDSFNSLLYTVDDLNRIVGVERGLLNGDASVVSTLTTSPYLMQEQDWTLDKNGNWNETIMDYWDDSLDETEVREVNETNEYVDISIQNATDTENVTVRYDNNGNMIRYRNFIFYYDVENRLDMIVHDEDPGGVLYEFEYGPLGHRVTTIDRSSFPNDYVYLHLYADGHEIQEIRSESFGDFETPLREYVYGATGLLAMIDNTSLGVESAGVPEVFYYLQDGQSSVVALTNDTGAVVERCHYEPYGDTWVSNDSGVLIGDGKSSSVGNPFMWKSMRYDDLSDLYVSSARYYSPELGRFLQRNPAGYSLGMNLYEYVASNPVKDKIPKFFSDYYGGYEITPDGDVIRLSGIDFAPYHGGYSTNMPLCDPYYRNKFDFSHQVFDIQLENSMSMKTAKFAGYTSNILFTAAGGLGIAALAPKFGSILTGGLLTADVAANLGPLVARDVYDVDVPWYLEVVPPLVTGGFAIAAEIAAIKTLKIPIRLKSEMSTSPLSCFGFDAQIPHTLRHTSAYISQTSFSSTVPNAWKYIAKIYAFKPASPLFDLKSWAVMSHHTNGVNRFVLAARRIGSDIEFRRLVIEGERWAKSRLPSSARCGTMHVGLNHLQGTSLNVHTHQILKEMGYIPESPKLTWGPGFGYGDAWWKVIVRPS